MAEYTIGLDLGGTNLRAAAIDRSGGILGSSDWPTDLSAGREAVLDCLTGIGIGVPGFILLREGVLRNAGVRLRFAPAGRVSSGPRWATRPAFLGAAYPPRIEDRTR